MKIKVGIVGAGANTKLRHIPGLRALPDVEIVSVCNRSRESGQRVAAELGIPVVYDRWQDLVSAPDTNAIVIGTWPYLHAPVTLAALAAGKHVLTEARMAMNTSEARAMWKAAQAHPNLVAQVVPAPFTLRVDRTVQRLIAEGYVGRVLAADVRASTGFLDPEAPLHWRQDRELSGVNMMTLGIWYEQMIRWVGHATKVSASGKVFVKKRRDATGAWRDVSVPEHLNVVADLPAGGQLHLMISAVAGLAGPAEAFVFGSEGTLRFCGEKLFGGKRGDKEWREISIPESEAGRWRVEEEFINAIRGKEPVRLTTFADGVKYMEFTEAAALSMETGQAVSLPLLQE
jgi:predicted dehydrogenase